MAPKLPSPKQHFFNRTVEASVKSTPCFKAWGFLCANIAAVVVIVVEA